MAKRGKWNGGWVPIGYEYDKATKHLQPHPDEAELLRNMFKLAVKCQNATKVAKILNEKGQRTRPRVLIKPDGSERVIGEKRFIGDRVKAIIRNEVYKGVIKHGDTEYPSEHPALVSAKLWEEANAALKRREGQPKKLQPRDKYFHLLKGLLVCGECGTSLTPHPSGKKDPDGNPFANHLGQFKEIRRFRAEQRQ